MSRRLRDKYRRTFQITAPGILGGTVDEVAEEKLVRVVSTGLDITTVVYIEASIIGSENWTQIGAITGNSDKIFDISLYDKIRYNVFTYGGTPSRIEAVSAVDSDQNVISQDIDGKDALRVIDHIPPEGDAKTAYLNALLTLNFWTATGFPVVSIDFVTTDDGEPILDRFGNFIEV